MVTDGDPPRVRPTGGVGYTQGGWNAWLAHVVGTRMLCASVSVAKVSAFGRDIGNFHQNPKFNLTLTAPIERSREFCGRVRTATTILSFISAMV